MPASRTGILRASLLAVLLATFGSPAAPAAAAFIAEVVAFTPGSGSGFGQDRLPDVVLGPPHGSEFEGSLDVLSLGHGGEIIVRLAGGGACDGPGPDFTVFENAFRIGGADSAVFVEVGIVAVSADGSDFIPFPYDPETLVGLAGRTPVLSHPDNGIDPRDPDISGGDAFDLADLGLDRVLFVRITDPGDAIPDPGNRIPPGNSAGFDLDAIAVVHPCSGDIPTPTATATATATATEVASATPLPIATPTPRPGRLPGDADGDGRVDVADIAVIVAEFFDGDGDRAIDASGGRVRAHSGADANGDGIVSAADLAATILLLASP